jgi:hypothetical protein
MSGTPGEAADPAEPAAADRPRTLRPLGLVGIGFLVVALHDPVHSYDLFADPVGWLLVLLGLRRIAQTVRLPLALVLGYLGVIALLCSVATWWPATQRSLDHADPSVVWAIGLGELLFQTVLCHALAGGAREAAEPNPALWFRACELVLIVCTAAPVLVFGAGIDALRGVVAVAALVRLVVPILCLVYSGRAWAGASTVPAVDTDQ